MKKMVSKVLAFVMALTVTLGASFINTETAFAREGESANDCVWRCLFASGNWMFGDLVHNKTHYVTQEEMAKILDVEEITAYEPSMDYAEGYIIIGGGGSNYRAEFVLMNGKALSLFQTPPDAHVEIARFIRN